MGPSTVEPRTGCGAHTYNLAKPPILLLGVEPASHSGGLSLLPLEDTANEVGADHSAGCGQCRPSPNTVELQRCHAVGENIPLAQGQPGAKAGGERFLDPKGKDGIRPCFPTSTCLLGEKLHASVGAPCPHPTQKCSINTNQKSPPEMLN